MLRANLIAILLSAGFLFNFAHAQEQDCASLRPVYVENPRFDPLTDSQIKLILAAAGEQANKLFGICVKFEGVSKMPIADAFGNITEPLQKWIEPIIVRDASDAEVARLAGVMAAGLKAEKSSFKEQLAYAQRSGVLSLEKTASVSELAAAVMKYHAETLRAYRQAKYRDGMPLVDSNPYNEFMYWLILPKTVLTYDLYLTNQPIVSLESSGPSLHASLRGGITNGLTTPCAMCKYGTAIVVSLYAIFAQDALLKKIRTESAYTERERTLFSGQLLTHEIGHQQLHFGHPYGLEDCVMNPVERLNFRQRSDLLTSNGCARGRSPALEPGAAGFKDLAAPMKPAK